jgi:ferric-dicitrate binding protein FerR (iron transport regulator)
MSKEYGKYTIEDFIIDDDFIQWAKYPTDETDNFWHTFIKNEPSQSSTIQKAKLAVQQLAIAAQHTAPADEIPVIWNEIEGNLGEKPKNIFGRFAWKNWAVAASILLILGLGFWWQFYVPISENSVYSKLTSNSSNSLNEIINTSSKELDVILPDGSKALLKPKSRLSYNKTFDGNLREVYLAGEAFFEVTKNPQKPFMVYANGLTTKVLGTSFSVKAFETDKEVIVKVTTGKVSVYAQNTSRNQDPEINGFVLTPNQKIIFGKEDERFTRTLVEKPVVLISNQELQQFSFNDAPIEQIFLALEKAYGVKIIFDKDVVSNCHLTTSLSNENLFEKLDIICAGIEANYKVVDAQVIITSNGCN